MPATPCRSRWSRGETDKHPPMALQRRRPP